MKTITTDQQIENAIRWIDALDPKEGFKKTKAQLGTANNPNKDVNDIKKDMSYCCLGVGCRIMEYKDVKWDAGSHYGLSHDMGMYSDNGIFSDPKNPSDGMPFRLDVDGYDSKPPGLISLNDFAYGDDRDFSRMRKFFLKNLEYIFIPEVAEGLKKHYSTKK